MRRGGTTVPTRVHPVRMLWGGILALALLLPVACSETEDAPATSSSYPEGPYGSLVGDTLPNFTLHDLQDQRWNSGALHAGDAEVAILYLTANWCFTCGPEVEWLNERMGTDKRVVGVAIVMENEHMALASPEDGVKFRDRYQPRFPVLVDPEGVVQPLRRSEAIPLNLVVRTDTMKIVARLETFDRTALEQSITAAIGDSR